MNIVTGILLIVVPLGFNVLFFMLQRGFDYPGILRRPTAEILQRFAAGGTRLQATWYAFAFTGLLFIPIPVLVFALLFAGSDWYLLVGSVIGMFAGLLQTIGLMRWPFLVPTLVAIHGDPASSPARREAAEVTFEAFHRFVGGAIGEHLGYMLTALWSLSVCATLILRPTGIEPWLGWVGLLPALGILYGILEEVGVKSAAMVNAIAYILWSVWLIALGVRVLLL